MGLWVACCKVGRPRRVQRCEEETAGALVDANVAMFPHPRDCLAVVAWTRWRRNSLQDFATKLIFAEAPTALQTLKISRQLLVEPGFHGLGERAPACSALSCGIRSPSNRSTHTHPGRAPGSNQCG